LKPGDRSTGAVSKAEGGGLGRGRPGAANKSGAECDAWNGRDKDSDNGVWDSKVHEAAAAALGPLIAWHRRQPTPKQASFWHTTQHRSLPYPDVGKNVGAQCVPSWTALVRWLENLLLAPSAAGDHNGPGWTTGAVREERVGGRVSTAH
jgi:hypothetical protein